MTTVKKINSRRFYVRLQVMVPIVFGGIALLTGIVAFTLSERSRLIGFEPVTAVTVWVLISTTLGVLVGFLVTRLILAPVEEFAKEAEKSRAFKDSHPPKQMPDRRANNEIDYFRELFSQVTEILSRVEARERFPQILGESRAMRAVLSQIAKVAPTDSSVLLLGESGTGKELVAQALHAHSRRKNKPFVKINCAAIPEELMESELFGHEAGAFTGAVGRKKGKFETAEGGTVFLDEIGDMSLRTQARILRVLQEKEFQRVGGNQTLTCDVRFLAATNKNLDEMVTKGLFREDLLYRIRVFTLVLPPLRARREDIPLLAARFLQNGSQHGKNLSFSREALHLMIAHPWPGNVRELQNAVERAVVFSEGPYIEPRHLPPEISISGGTSSQADSFHSPGIDDKLREMEKAMITDALRCSRGVQVKAAALLGINQRSLWHRIKKHGIDVNEFKNQTDHDA